MVPLCFLVLFLSWANASIDKISPSLQTQLRSESKVNILVSFDGTGSACEIEPPSNSNTHFLKSPEERGAHVTRLRDVLMEKAKSSQNGVLQLLSARSAAEAVTFTDFWITNQVFVRGADEVLIQQIAADPKVTSIDKEVFMTLFDGGFESDANFPLTCSEPKVKPNADGEPQWHLKNIQAPEAWKEVGGNPGEGIVIGVIDSGAWGTHENIKDNFVGEYGWYDPHLGKLEPYDDRGHGTQVIGMAVGKQGIGVAPSAKWAACKACRVADKPCPIETLLICGQFFTCPTLPDGSKPDCSKAPHIINNSWGRPGGGSDPTLNYYDGVIKCWHKAGIIPVFAIGNTGIEQCGHTAYPASHPDVIGVGYTENDDFINDASSQGPTHDMRIKPDIVAPGKDVVVPDRKFDYCYIVTSGSSFASPLVAGSIAVMLAKEQHKLNYEQVKQRLLASTNKLCRLDADCCGVFPMHHCPNGTSRYPNSVYGHGKINVLYLVTGQKQHC